ncbi:MAG TPA: efflux RND transporter periplasmic adaptor subunit [Candidatus Limnocylindria bacterium]|jgi:RND family efflux transporter MFP subunit|nr:efflux RND transporter periplasmic adaptor subunit [Candidatus Limnocylindria bacterium]
MNARSHSFRYGGVLALLLLSFAGPGCKRDQADDTGALAERDVVRLGVQDVGEAVSRNVMDGIHIIGTVNPSVRVEVKAQVGGLIDTVLVDRGLVVTQNQVLAVFADRAMVAQLQSAKAQVAAAERDNAATELLFKAGAASERAFVNTKVGVDSARAQLTQIEDNYNNATIRSPIAGVVSERLVSAGESAGPGQKLFSVVNSSTLELTTAILPVDFSAVKVGMKAVMTFDSFGDRKIEGIVSRLDPVADARSRQVGVSIEIPNQEGELVAGIFGSGTILTNTGSMEKLMLIPSSAVRKEGDKSVVYTIGNGKLVRRVVSVDERSPEEGRARINSGLTEGDKIVLSPSAQLKDSAVVRILALPTQ